MTRWSQLGRLVRTVAVAGAVLALAEPAVPLVAQDAVPAQPAATASGGQEQATAAEPAGEPAGAPEPVPGTYDEAIESQVNQLATELRCPVCTGTSMAESPTELSLQMRAIMREQLQAGRTPDEVKDYFVSKYGEWILLEPKASGFNLTVYVLPWVGLLAGLALVIWFVRRWLPSGATTEREDGVPPEPAEPATWTGSRA